MPDLGSTRRRLTIAFIALGVVDLLAIGVIVSPLAGAQRARGAQLRQLEKDLQVKTKAVEPLRGFDAKIAVARKQIDTFYKDRLPVRDSAVSEALGRVATESGVKISHFGYKMQDPEPVGLRPVLIEASLSGNYLQLVRFINSLERDQLFFIVDSVELGSEHGGVVQLQMKLETYLKTGTT
jgi:type IV pilus assembly protein PilO